MLSAIMAQVWPYVLAAGGAVAALLAAYLKGRRAAADRAARKAAEDYIEKRKRMDAVSTPDDADAADKWLRDRAER